MNITTMSVPSPTRCSESTVKRRFVSSTTYTKVTVENPKIHAHRSHKLGRMTKVHTAGLVVVLAAIYVIMSKFSSSLYTSSHILKHTRPEKNVNLTNEFVSTFAKIIREDRPTFNTENAVPLILKNGKILCSSTHKRQIQQMRVLAFLEMVSRGLELDYYHSTSYANDGLPILLMNGDGMGCNITSHTDSLPFPRLSWSIPSPKHDEETSWCHSVGMVSYETWNAFHKRHDKHHTWDDTFANDEYRHPWESKIPKAIWRGTSTHEQTRTKDWEFEDIPRAVLVKAGMENPDVIDAGFTAIIQKFEKDKEELEKRTRMGDYIPFVDQMKYKAFIDIDGNNWSSRFIRLLCTNSVVIKIDPDYVEYFYDDLTPNIHYVPASLENITEVARYVVDPKNDEEMRNVVKAANSWCKRTVTEEVLIRDEMFQLEAYESALDAYGERNNWIDEWREFMMAGFIDDLVDCGV